MTDVLTAFVTSPVVVFLLALAAALILYWIGGEMAPRFVRQGGKAKAYTGGEDIPGKKYQVSYQFYHLALIFTVLHVTALIVATAFMAGAGVAAIIYLLIAAIAIAAVLVGW